MEQAEATWTVEVRLMVDPEKTDREGMTRVHNALKRYPGPCKGFVHICLKDQVEAVVSMTEEMRIRYCDAMVREVNAILGYNAVQTRIRDAASAMRHNGQNGRRNNGNGRGYHRN